MIINCKSINQKEQRYPTVGDYWENTDGSLEIRTTSLEDWREEFLILFHEMIEFMLCKHRKIKEEDITNFDIAFENDKERISKSLSGEPGDEKDAPYYKEHQFATGMERLMASALEVDWDRYDLNVERAFNAG